MARIRECPNCCEVHGSILPPLDTYDWKEAFKYAQPHHCEAGHAHGPQAAINESVSTEHFTRESVERIIGLAEGNNDGPDWIGVFLLKDGRFACLRAGCDYTGWG